MDLGIDWKGVLDSHFPDFTSSSRKKRLKNLISFIVYGLWEVIVTSLSIPTSSIAVPSR